MYVSRLSLINYRNFETRSLEFRPGINCLVGPNGIGKTTVLDAVYHLCFGKSYFNPVSTQNIRFGEAFFMIEGGLVKQGMEDRVQCSFKKGHKKILKRNGKEYEKLRDHIGLYPAVIISPADRDLISEGSEVRRKFIDGVVSQIFSDYLDKLLKYNKILEQRNALLKYFALNSTYDGTNLEIYNEQLSDLGTEIHRRRLAFVEEFRPLLLEQHRVISDQAESVDCHYQSQLDEAPLKELLRSNEQKDLRLQFTTQGIHKDDFSFQISDHPIKKYGSQGQQKTFLIALKLAQWEYIRSALKTAPVLLLDDIFDKLDERRVGRLIELVSSQDYEQVLISDTQSERTERAVQKATQDFNLIALDK